jgi:Flp pilus assembly secretin CpaC
VSGPGENSMSEKRRTQGWIRGFAMLAALSLLTVSSSAAKQRAISAPETQAARQTAHSSPAKLSSATPAAAESQQPVGQVSEAPLSLHLMVGRSLVITSPTRIKRVSLADPSIAEAIVVSPYQVLVNGKAPGGVSLLLWDESDQSQAFEVSVDIDILSLSEKIHEVFPNEPVQVET